MSLTLTALSLSVVYLMAQAKVADSAGHETLLLSSVAFDSGSANGLLKSSSFEACELSSEPADLLRWKFEMQRDERQVSARFFGRPKATLSDFNVTEDCQGLRLRNYRSQQIYTGPALKSCVVAFYSDAQYFTFVVNITGTPDVWALSLPLIDSLVITKASCQSADVENCALAHSPPCQNQTLVSFATDKKSETCKECAGAKADETMNGRALLYGLRATYFKLDGCQKDNKAKAPCKAPDLAALQPDPETTPRCQDALSYQAYNTVWETVPPLAAESYTGCFGAELDGYVLIPWPKTVGKSKHNRPANMSKLHKTALLQSACRVCVRYNAAVSVRIGDKSLVVAAPSPDYDLLLSCVDANGSAGLKPIIVQYMGSPGSTARILTAPDAVLQLFITPASTGRGQAGVTYDCKVCPLFARQAAGCCTPLTTKDFRTATCSSRVPTQQSGESWSEETGAWPHRVSPRNLNCGSEANHIDRPPGRAGQQPEGSPVGSARARALPARARPAANPPMHNGTPRAGVQPSRQLRAPQRAPVVATSGKADEPAQYPGPTNASKPPPRPARSWGSSGQPRTGANLTSQPAQAPKQAAPRSKPLNSSAPSSSAYTAASGRSRAPVLPPQPLNSPPSETKNAPGRASGSPRAVDRQCRNNDGYTSSSGAPGCPTSASELYGWSTVAPYETGVTPSPPAFAYPPNGLVPQPFAGSSSNTGTAPGTVGAQPSGCQMSALAKAPSPTEKYVSWTELQRMAADNATSCADIKKAIIRGINLT